MTKHYLAVAAAAALLVELTVAASAATAADTEFAFMSATANVTLLNAGGKYVAVDMKKIETGQPCRMDKDATIMKVESNATSGMTRVRSLMPQVSSGGCPFMTEFEISNADYEASRKAFLAKEDEAKKKVEDLKAWAGEKWAEITGQSSAQPPVQTK